MRLRSRSGPPACLTALAMSLAVIDPNSFPPAPARARRVTERDSSCDLSSCAWLRSRISRASRARLICAICRSARCRCVRKQRHLPCVLDRPGDLALLLRADPGDAARPNLAAVRDELAQQRRVLVVDVLNIGHGEWVLLLFRLTRRLLGHDRVSPN